MLVAALAVHVMVHGSSTNGRNTVVDHSCVYVLIVHTGAAHSCKPQHQEALTAYHGAAAQSC